MAEVVSLARRVEHLTADAAAVAEKTGEGRELRSLIAELIAAIIDLPRSARSLRDRIARAEAESVRLACHKVEWNDDISGAGHGRRVLVAIQELDVALVRFAVLAR